MALPEVANGVIDLWHVGHLSLELRFELLLANFVKQMVPRYLSQQGQVGLSIGPVLDLLVVLIVLTEQTLPKLWIEQARVIFEVFRLCLRQ